MLFSAQTDRFAQTKLFAEEQQERLAAARKIMLGWQEDETALLSAVGEEHSLLRRTGERLSEALSSLHDLVATVDRNKAMIVSIP